MNKGHQFYLVCLGFMSGVLWRSLWHIHPGTLLFFGLAYLFLISYSRLVLKKDWIVLISIFTLAFFLGILRFQLADAPPPEAFESQVGQTVSISGLIIDAPARDGNGVKLTMRAELRGETAGVAVFAKSNEVYRYGDDIEITGKLERPKNFMTDQGLEFDYANYLRKDGIFYVARNPKIKIISSGNGNFIKSALLNFKNNFSNAIDSAIPAPENFLMDGIILGERGGFSQELRQSFTNTGTIHIVTVGGYHITLVAEWITKIFGFLPKYGGDWAGIASIVLYVIVTGGAQASVRAGIMAALALLAVVTGRVYEASHALALAAIIMILINPFVLAFDASFELSFIAAIAIIFLSPRIERHLQLIRWRWLRDIVAVTGAMYMFALPFILYRIGTLSLVALPANIAIVPLLPASMLAGFATGFAGLVLPPAAFLPAKIAYALLHYQITIINRLAGLPFASLAIPNFPLVIVIIVYAIFVWIFVSDSREKEVPQDSRFFVLMLPLVITLSFAGLLYYRHYESNQNAKQEMQTLLAETPATKNLRPFEADARTKFGSCQINGPYPDHACTPGAIFKEATAEKVCVRGYSQSVRNVSTKMRKQVYGEYGISYPEPRGAYEVDHFIPLALGGSNDIANLFPEAAEPAPGFHEKDIVEVYLQEEVCSGRAALSAAERQIAADWLAVYNNLTPEERLAIQKKYSGR